MAVLASETLDSAAFNVVDYFVQNFSDIEAPIACGRLRFSEFIRYCVMYQEKTGSLPKTGIVMPVTLNKAYTVLTSRGEGRVNELRNLSNALLILEALLRSSNMHAEAEQCSALVSLVEKSVIMLTRVSIKEHPGTVPLLTALEAKSPAAVTVQSILRSKGYSGPKRWFNVQSSLLLLQEHGLVETGYNKDGVMTFAITLRGFRLLQEVTASTK
jgi:hypothetical protein